MNLEKRPVLGGVIALVAVALVVGLVAGLAALAGTRVLGLDDGSAASAGRGGGTEPKAGETLHLPKPSKTDQPSDPLVTLDATEESPEEEETEPTEEESDKKSKKNKKTISLSAGQTSVSGMERIDLTGTYPGGEGAVLQVQRLEGDTWTDFPVTMTVSNSTFTTYVQSSQTGPTKFRVVDSDTDQTSNAVTVTIR